METEKKQKFRKEILEQIESNSKYKSNNEQRENFSEKSFIDEMYKSADLLRENQRKRKFLLLNEYFNEIMRQNNEKNINKNNEKQEDKKYFEYCRKVNEIQENKEKKIKETRREIWKKIQEENLQNSNNLKKSCKLNKTLEIEQEKQNTEFLQTKMENASQIWDRSFSKRLHKINLQQNLVMQKHCEITALRKINEENEELKRLKFMQKYEHEQNKIKENQEKLAEIKKKTFIENLKQSIKEKSELKLLEKDIQKNEYNFLNHQNDTNKISRIIHRKKLQQEVSRNLFDHPKIIPLENNMSPTEKSINKSFFNFA